MLIRKAGPEDFKALYELGKNTPELIVSADEEFMEAKTFKGFITDKNCVSFLQNQKEGLRALYWRIQNGLILWKTRALSRALKRGVLRVFHSLNPPC